MDTPGEDLVFAVFRPRLRDALQFDIGRLIRKPEGRSGALRRVGGKVISDCVHLVKAERKDPFAADAHKLGIRSAQIISAHPRIGFFTDRRDSFIHGRGSPFLGGENLDGLDQRIGQQVPGDALHIGPREPVPAEKVLDGGVNGFRVLAAAVRAYPEPVPARSSRHCRSLRV